MDSEGEDLLKEILGSLVRVARGERPRQFDVAGLRRMLVLGVETLNQIESKGAVESPDVVWADWSESLGKPFLLAPGDDVRVTCPVDGEGVFLRGLDFTLAREVEGDGEDGGGGEDGGEDGGGDEDVPTAAVARLFGRAAKQPGVGEIVAQAFAARAREELSTGDVLVRVYPDAAQEAAVGARWVSIPDGRIGNLHVGFKGAVTLSLINRTLTPIRAVCLAHFARRVR